MILNVNSYLKCNRLLYLPLFFFLFFCFFFLSFLCLCASFYYVKSVQTSIVISLCLFLVELTNKNNKIQMYGERAFAVAAPKLWNSIPLELRSSSSIDILKRHLKTYLFKQAF